MSIFDYGLIRHSEINGSNVKTLFPGGRIKEQERNLKIADTNANRLRLAEEYARQQNFKKAMVLTVYASKVFMEKMQTSS